jgi:chemotaxis protein CheC
MNNQRAIWKDLVSGPQSEYLLRKAMWHVTSGLSDTVGRTITNDPPCVERVPIAQVATRAGDPETERVGIYLVLGSGLRGQAILILPLDSALNLADLFMGEQAGTAAYLGVVERSALAEVGNMAVSYFLNAVSTISETPEILRPSPPAVMVDMLGAILDVIVTPVAAVRDDLLIIETAFKDSAGAIRGHFWVLPDPTIQDLG